MNFALTDARHVSRDCYARPPGTEILLHDNALSANRTDLFWSDARPWCPDRKRCVANNFRKRQGLIGNKEQPRRTGGARSVALGYAASCIARSLTPDPPRLERASSVASSSANVSSRMSAASALPKVSAQAINV